MSAPKQQRSRESFARVKAATIALLQDPATVDFRLADVSRVSGVSIGAIYTRVQSKNDLLRAVQWEEYDRIDRSVREISDVAEGSADFGDAVTRTVTALIGHLVDNAGILRAFMRLSGGDEHITARGMRSGDVAEASFTGALLAAAAQWAVPASTAGAAWCFDLTFSVVARHLGFGVAAGGLPRDPLPPPQLADELSRTVIAYLVSAQDDLAGSPAG